MRFTGHSEATIDAKQRLAVPSKHRQQLDPETNGRVWYSIPWPMPGRIGVIRLFPESTFLALGDSRGQTLTPDADLAQLEADLFGLAERLEMDKTGRVRLPKSHLDLTGLPEAVVVTGAWSRLEVTDRESWQAQLAERFSQMPGLVERIAQRTGGA